MIEIVKIGYKKLEFYELYNFFISNFSIYARTPVLDDREEVKEKIKTKFAYYYSKRELLKEPINWHDALCNVDGDSTYNVVQIPQKELEMILLKNKLGGYLIENIIQEKEFDKDFDEFYPKLLEKMQKDFFYNWTA